MYSQTRTVGHRLNYLYTRYQQVGYTKALSADIFILIHIFIPSYYNLHDTFLNYAKIHWRLSKLFLLVTDDSMSAKKITTPNETKQNKNCYSITIKAQCQIKKNVVLY